MKINTFQIVGKICDYDIFIRSHPTTQKFRYPIWISTKKRSNHTSFSRYN